MPDDDTKRQLLAIHADYQFWTVVEGVGSPEAAEAFARLETACRTARVKLNSVSNEKKAAVNIHESSVDTGAGKVSVYANSHHLALTVTSCDDSAAVILDRSEVEKVINNLDSWLRASRDDDGSH